MTGAVPPPAILAVSSFVACGGVGLRAVQFALERLGHEVVAVPTVHLPWHPGHGPGTRIVPPPDAFAATLRDLSRAPWLGQVGAVVSGYLGEQGQAAAVAALVDAVKAANPDALYLCDPVFGDDGALYVGEPVARAIARELMPRADVATPNLTELNWLTGSRAIDAGGVFEAARGLGPHLVAVTSVPGMMRGRIGALMASGNAAWLAEHTLVAHPPHGPGDLFAAVLTAALVAGAGPEAALVRAAATTFEMVAASVKTGGRELALARAQEAIVRPATQIAVRRLAGAGRQPATK